MKKLLLPIFVFISLGTFGQVVLPKIFGDHMVLQRDEPILIWGISSPKEKISASFHNQKKTTVADAYGKWQVSFASEAAGGPYQLTLKGKNSVTLNDILVGDVWLCSGQSNMEWPLINTENSNAEIRKAKYPNIRHFKVPITVASVPQDDIKNGEWKVCSEETAAEFTAVGYYFARRVSADLNVPIGLINSTWGGTQVESWISKDALGKHDEFKDLVKNLGELNLDSLASQKYKKMVAKIEALQGGLPKDKSEVSGWVKADLDDSRWPTMVVPKLWEEQVVGDFDGVIWLRKEFIINENGPFSSAKLSLSMIDDTDETFINGEKIGATNGWNVSRSYEIPVSLLKKGKNVIAIRVEDTGGGGGIYGDSSLVKLTLDNRAIELAGPWKYKVESPLAGRQFVSPNSYPTILYNAMINPIIRYGIKGALWYQGEANAGRAYQYRKAFPLLIADWRSKFNDKNLPFYFVQLATFNAGNGTSATGSMWAELREAQTLTASVPYTGMAVTIDIGDPLDIHPRNKKGVGERLALLALNRTYNINILDAGPVLKSVRVETDKIVLTFDQELIVKDKYQYIRGFEIAGQEQKFLFAKAEAVGNEVTVWTKAIIKPVAVRYGWADDASDCNLFNSTGLPVGPFRTDNWKGITENARFEVSNQ